MKQTTLTQETINQVLNDTALSKSKRFTELYNLGLDIKTIASLCNVRYNFVYNVISNYCRINDVELTTNQKTTTTKKDEIINLLKQNKTNTEISKELKVNYQYVYKISKEYFSKQ